VDGRIDDQFKDGGGDHAAYQYLSAYLANSI